MKLVLQVIALAAAGMAAACADAPPQELAADPAAELAPAEPMKVVVTAKDFAFAMPDTLTAGTVHIELVNEGPDFHHLELVRLPEGRTLEELMTTIQQQHELPEWAVEMGGPNTPGMPGESTNATFQLEPGNYVALCVIPGADGVPHLMKGMVKPVTVVAGTSTPAPLPEADIVMTLDDYSFATSSPITAGRHIIRIENAAKQGHEVLIVKLEPGRTPADFAKFVQKPEGSPPGRVLGGIAGLSHGRVSQIELEFEPGEYALLCFLPDATDGAPHVAHGMMQQITVN